jgi:hypothetical protein
MLGQTMTTGKCHFCLLSALQELAAKLLCLGQGLQPRACEVGGSGMVEELKAAFPPFRLCLYRQFARAFLFTLSLKPTSRLAKMQ